jgi:serine/threonine-protein kinase
LQDEINADLGRIAGLKVIGSESTQNYPPHKRELQQIGQELGVKHLVEGSVRRTGDDIHLAVKLFDLADLGHPWTAEYSGTLSEVFSLQEKITLELASKLGVTPSAAEKNAIGTPRTADPVAHDLYLRAIAPLAPDLSPQEWHDEVHRRFDLLQEAVKRDPDFVLAYCQIANVHDSLYQASDVLADERSVDHRSLAEVALQQARRLRPGDGNVHLAMAHHLMAVVRDNEQAQIELDLARRSLPNDATLEEDAAMNARRQGHWNEALAAYERAVALEPREEGNYNGLIEIQRCLRHYDDAERALARRLALDPVGRKPRWQLDHALVVLESRADPAPLRAALDSFAHESIPADVAADLDYCRVVLAYVTRDFDTIPRLLDAITDDEVYAIEWVYPKAWFLGVAARARGEVDASRAAFTQARADVDKMLERSPRSFKLNSLSAVIDAALGRKDDAVGEARHALELVPRTGSATVAPGAACNQALVYAWTGQPDQAFALLDDLTRKPAGINLMYQPSYGDLRLNPVWDPLRKDPRFEALLQRLAPVEGR